eukprot:g6808.t1
MQAKKRRSSVSSIAAAFQAQLQEEWDPNKKAGEKSDRKKYDYVGGLNRDLDTLRDVLAYLPTDQNGCVSFGAIFKEADRRGGIANLIKVLQNLRAAGEIDFKGQILFQGTDDNVPIRILTLPTPSTTLSSSTFLPFSTPVDALTPSPSSLPSSSSSSLPPPSSSLPPPSAKTTTTSTTITATPHSSSSSSSSPSSSSSFPTINSQSPNKAPSEAIYRVTNENAYRYQYEETLVPLEERHGRSFALDNLAAAGKEHCVVCREFIPFESRLVVRDQVYHMRCVTCHSCSAHPQSNIAHVSFDGHVFCTDKCLVSYEISRGNKHSKRG